MALTRCCALVFVILSWAAVPAAAKPRAVGKHHGGTAFVSQEELTRATVPGSRAVLLDTGFAAAPRQAPPAVKEAIWAANTLQDKPYVYGGGHGDFADDGYDCSGTVSFALNAAGLLNRPRDSSGFMRYGAPGPGRWISVYTNPGHAYVVLAGLRLDTSAAGSGGGRGPRWRGEARASQGFVVRHPVGY